MIRDTARRLAAKWQACGCKRSVGLLHLVKAAQQTEGWLGGGWLLAPLHHHGDDLPYILLPPNVTRLQARASGIQLDSASSQQCQRAPAPAVSVSLPEPLHAPAVSEPKREPGVSASCIICDGCVQLYKQGLVLISDIRGVAFEELRFRTRASERARSTFCSACRLGQSTVGCSVCHAPRVSRVGFL